MHTKEFFGQKAAFLVENGVCERELKQSITAMEALGLSCRLFSVESGVVKGWNKAREERASYWGDEYAVHDTIDRLLPADYSALILPGGTRSVDKIKFTPSLRSILSGFVLTGKPVVAYNYAISLLIDTDLVKGYSIAAGNTSCEALRNKGGHCASPEFIVSKNLVTLSRYREAQEKIATAVSCILSGEPYVEKVVFMDGVPFAHKVA